MNICKNCGKETKNNKYCGYSCRSSYINKHIRKKEIYSHIGKKAAITRFGEIVEKSFICTFCNKEKKYFERKKIDKNPKRFCSRICANTYVSRLTNTIEKKKKIKNSLIDYYKKNKSSNKGKCKDKSKHSYQCEKCNKYFESDYKIKKDRHVHCYDCKRKVIYKLDNPQSICDLSKRTITKIFQRLKIGCSRCGWSEGLCDLHHIIYKKNGGNDCHENLCYLCPNCHRLAHSKLINNFVSLQQQIGDEWKKYYVFKKK